MVDAYHLRKHEFSALGVQVYSSNYTLYGDISARVMRVLSDFTPDLEIYSIDEAFLCQRRLKSDPLLALSPIVT